MGIYTFDLKPVRFIDSNAGNYADVHNYSFVTHPTPVGEVDIIVAYLNVSYSSNGNGIPECKIDPDKKIAVFSTYRPSQRLDLILRLDPSVKEDLYICRTKCSDNRASTIDYLDETTTPPTWYPEYFNNEILKNPKRISLHFHLKPDSVPLNYEIWLKDKSNNPIQLPCDPQVKNDPPLTPFNAAIL